MTKTRRIGIIALVLTLVAAFCIAFFLPASGTDAKAEEAQTKAIDMYLIAGQSNAAGYSYNIGSGETFSNVMYAGEVDKWRTSGSASQSCIGSFAEFKKSVTTGLGKDASRMGPEYGMAKHINGLYGGDTKALIFKSAAGGTALRNITSGQSNDYGNWYPRSKWASGFTPDPATSPTGVQYKNFVDNFEKVYDILVAEGYTPKVKGMAWMQGCADLGAHAEYEGLLKAFISDIRTDIKNITGDNTMDQMPFVIGKIATTFSYAGNTNVPPFNAMQEKVATDMENVYTAETSDLIINTGNGITGVVGTDRYHFSASDAVTLGVRFAEKIVGARESFTLKFDYNETQGTVKEEVSPYKKITGQKTILSGDTLTIKITAKTGYQVDKVTLNDVEVAYNTTKKGYVLGPITENNSTVKVTFKEKPADSSQTSQGTTTSDGSDKTDSTTNSGSDKTDEENEGCNGKDIALAFALIGSLAAAALILKK